MMTLKRILAENVLQSGTDLWDKYKNHDSAEVRRLALRVKTQALILHDRILGMGGEEMNDQRRN